MHASTVSGFADAVASHDARLAKLGLEIWVGSEPTFTDRHHHGREWLSSALGGEKELRAQALVATLARATPGAVVLRSVGRRYPGEEAPRFSYGLYRRRNGAALWNGPPDPLLLSVQPTAEPDVASWAGHFTEALDREGWRGEATACVTETETSRTAHTLVSVRLAESVQDPLHFKLRLHAMGSVEAPQVELPRFETVRDFLFFLNQLEIAARNAGLTSLVIAGEQPPVDATVELTTVTPDPAVIEINTAPSRNAGEFLQRSRLIYEAAETQGLSPYRLYYNGSVADSGGGGQITLGGPAPETSPFIVEPRLLPRLVRFMNRHPSLSYLYSHDFAGSDGQSARADERGANAFDGLALALALLERHEQVTPSLVWRSLAPFLCDATGNSHRAEINVEKLANPFEPGRGQQGLVEFRALRMQHTPERATALACLMRAIVGMLATTPYDAPLIDWGRELHDRFALPYYLEQDFADVLAALSSAGLALGEPIEQVLLREEFRFITRIQLSECTLELRRALEFWPLLGDAASPEQGGSSRIIDASTCRLEIRLRPLDGKPDAIKSLSAVQVLAGGIPLPLRDERDAQGPLRVYAVRYRNFVPQVGLHPLLANQAPLELWVGREGPGTDEVITLHEWRPDREAYDGVPRDLEDAAQRRKARVTSRPAPRRELQGPQTSDYPPGIISAYCIDLRYLG